MRPRCSACRLCLPLLVLVLAAGCDRGQEVETLSPTQGRIEESFTEPARTRLARDYLVTMPVDGRIGRIELEPGDAVKANEKLVEFDLVPLDSEVAEAQAAVEELGAELTVKDDHSLERTAAKEADAAVKAADEALNAYDEEVEAEKARATRARKQFERKKQLAERKVISEDELDDFALANETALIELRKQQFYRAALKALIVAVNLGPRAIDEYIAKKKLERVVLVHKLAQAKARLARAQHNRALAAIQSPIDGVVLERYEKGNRTVSAGERLLLIGSLDELEVEADVLTQDALRIGKGSRVSLEPATGLEPIPGEVSRIEPAGFTKLSSLGVEQQRVKVIVALRGDRGALGVGYRLQARFFTGQKDGTLIVPRYSVLQAPDRSYYVLKAVDGEVRKQPVTLGLRSDLELEVVEGLSRTDTIIARPDATMKEGMRVKPLEPRSGDGERSS